VVEVGIRTRQARLHPLQLRTKL